MSHHRRKSRAVNRPFEAYLWILLNVLAIVGSPTKVSPIVSLCSLLFHLFYDEESLEPSMNSYRWWRNVAEGSSGDKEGLAMRIVLPPVLLQYMSRSRNDTMERYALLVAVASTGNKLNLSAVAAFSFIEKALLSPKNLVFLACWMIFYQSIVYCSPLHSVWTQGEWYLVTLAAALIFTECFLGDCTVDQDNLSFFVSMWGLIGTVLGCIAVNKRGTVHQSLATKCAVLVGMTLLVLESNFVWIFGLSIVPHSLSWLLDFLWQPEIALVPICLWRRIAWVLYWAVIVCVSLPLAPPMDNAELAIVRKWFHLVAVLLFLPVTMASPQLQSLAYAVALSILLMLECVRQDIPTVQAFYNRYIDRKDNGGMIVSHMTLIAGCAIPLWLSEWLDLDFIQVSIWGVVCLGIGDSMGAVVGTTYGQRMWGQERRTVEGSLAMLMSMMISFSVLQAFAPINVWVWMPACAFCSLLEAFTHQIDNLVLPLAGVSVMLVCRQLL